MRLVEAVQLRDHRAPRAVDERPERAVQHHQRGGCGCRTRCPSLTVVPGSTLLPSHVPRPVDRPASGRRGPTGQNAEDGRCSRPASRDDTVAARGTPSGSLRRRIPGALEGHVEAGNPVRTRAERDAGQVVQRVPATSEQLNQAVKSRSIGRDLEDRARVQPEPHERGDQTQVQVLVVTPRTS